MDPIGPEVFLEARCGGADDQFVFDPHQTYGQPRPIDDDLLKDRMNTFRRNPPTSRIQCLLWPLDSSGVLTPPPSLARGPAVFHHSGVKFIVLGGQHSAKAAILLAEDRVGQGLQPLGWQTAVKADILKLSTDFVTR